MALVRNGSTEALISLLGQSASVTSGVRLAALGAIKNFVIAAPSRKAVIEQGLIDPIVRLAQVKYIYQAMLWLSLLSSNIIFLPNCSKFAPISFTKQSQKPSISNSILNKGEDNDQKIET